MFTGLVDPQPSSKQYRQHIHVNINFFQITFINKVLLDCRKCKKMRWRFFFFFFYILQRVPRTQTPHAGSSHMTKTRIFIPTRDNKVDIHKIKNSILDKR